MALGSDIDPSSRNWALDSIYGDNHGSLFPSTLQFALFNGDPTGSGTELTSDGGYARIIVANTSANFPDASGGIKSIASTIQLAMSTGAFSATADHWAILSPNNHLMDSGIIVDPSTGDPATVAVTTDGQVVRFLGGTLSIAVA